MNDANLPPSGNPWIPRAGLGLLGLFVVQVAYQVILAGRGYVEVNADLSAELADAVFLDDEPAPESAGWPQWRGPHRDGVIGMAHLLTDWPKDGLPLLWSKPVDLGYSSFTVKDGRLYSLFQQGEQEVVACWRVEDGEEVWRYPYDCPSNATQYPGPRSTPTLDGDRLYTVGSAGKLLCLNTVTGELLWQKDLLSEFHAATPKWGVAFSPLIDGDLLFTSPGGANGNSLAAFHKTTGELAWKQLDEPAGYSSPVAVTIAETRQIIFFLADCVVGVTADEGKLCWRYPWETSYDVNAATPVTFRARRGDQILHYVFISSGYGRGCALLKIAAKPGGRFTAKKVYSGRQMCSHFASPVRRGEYLYGIDEARLICLNLRTGKVQWKGFSTNKGSLLRVNDSLLVLAETGRLFLLDASPDKCEAKAEARPLGPDRCWTMPVVAEGRLFLRDERRMKCLDLRGR
jgi:outer membrane protein assembly factor BamB